VRLEQQGLLWRLAAQQQDKQQGGQQQEGQPPHHRERALFFVNDTVPAFPSTASPAPLRYDPCSAAHAAAYLNREASGWMGDKWWWSIV
jgi:hypothetical protein